MPVKLAYITQYDSNDLKNWSGLGYYIGRALEGAGASIERFGPFDWRLKLFERLMRKLHMRILKTGFEETELISLQKRYAKQIARTVPFEQFDAIFSPHPSFFGFIDCPLPKFFWCDVVFSNLVASYPTHNNLSVWQRTQGERIQQRSLDAATAGVFTSAWAADEAVVRYRFPRERILIQPFGANIETNRDAAWLEQALNKRPAGRCNLLFIGRIWERKGADIAIEVAATLNASGLKTRLTIVGCQPPAGTQLPNFVELPGFIDKRTPEGKAAFDALFEEAHFFILPSRAEAFGVVFSEAASFGLPCLASRVGGIPNAVHEGNNGFTIPIGPNEVDQYFERIRNLTENREAYTALCRQTFSEYQTRMNWKTIGNAAVRYFQEHLNR